MASNRPKVEDLHLVNLTKSFDDFKAVDNLSLTIPAGSFFALLGPSGCGKTTTLRMVAGLDEPTSGQIKLGPDDITNLPPYKRWVNTVFQSYALFPHLTIYENVAFGLRRQKAENIDDQVKAMLELVELTTQAQKKPQQLSGGQQQRVALARALINEPDVLLLDEPLGALDLKLRRQMQLELKRIQTEVGITFVHVTHDQEEAMTMADTIAVMNEGKIEQLGSPVQIYEHPKTVFVANFLGQTNLFEGTVAGIEGDELVVKVKDTTFYVPLATTDIRSGRIILGVRPEKVKIVDQGKTGLPKNQINGSIKLTAFVGVSTQYEVITNWGQEISAFEQNVDPTDLGRPGQAVTLAWEPRHSFVLNPDDDLSAGLDTSWDE
ncbi:MAG: ABC transporter ATP-binding protein [Actinomycetota bacterium]|nr:ABC transporter ATP-binding protein [Actinomycetota bacterium]MDA3026148.1 ABC transporter ATP-binding protein [Actinomycetota bacterium]